MNKINRVLKVIKPLHCQVFNRKLSHVTSSCWNQDKNNPPRTLVVRDLFANAQVKDRKTYLEMIEIFESKDKFRRGHVEFISNALKYMEDFGVHKDIEVYKTLINVLPKGKFIPQNIFQSEFMHYPKQQQVAIDLLEQMEDNGVIPDVELEDILRNIFGRRGHPLRKYMRMLYWMPKFKNLSPWPLPNPVPNDALDLAKVAIERISIDLQTKINVYHTKDLKDSIDDTWIVSGQSPQQIKLLSEREKQTPVYVEGPFKLWLRDIHVNYFILRADPVKYSEDNDDENDVDDVSHIKIPMYELPKKVIVAPSVHEQDDGVILSICATGTSSKDSLLSWIRFLEQDQNPNLADLSVIFTLKQPGSSDLITTDSNDDKKLNRIKT